MTFARAEADLLGLGEKIIRLSHVHEHIGCAVVVEDHVYDVYRTRATTTFFVRFEPRGENDAPFDGFKVVIFPQYYSEWVNAGLDPYQYKGHYVRVRV